jgi:hypothetical protein
MCLVRCGFYRGVEETTVVGAGVGREGDERFGSLMPLSQAGSSTNTRNRIARSFKTAAMAEPWRLRGRFRLLVAACVARVLVALAWGSRRTSRRRCGTALGDDARGTGPAWVSAAVVA